MSTRKWDEQVSRVGETVPMKKPSQHFIAGVPRRQPQLEMTIGIDLGDVWSHYCTLNEGGDIVRRGRFRSAASTHRHGGGNALELNQRAAAGVRT